MRLGVVYLSSKGNWSMLPGVVGVRIALSITKMGESQEGNRQGMAEQVYSVVATGKDGLMTKLATAMLSSGVLALCTATSTLLQEMFALEHPETTV